MGSRPGEHPRPAVVRSLGATYMEIHCTQICAFGAYCSLSVQSQRQRPCLESVSQCCYVSGLSRDAGSIGELRRRTGRSMHALRRAVANAFPSARFIEFARVVKCNRSCPNGKVQLWHLVKVARVVSGEKTKAERWPRELKVNIPSGYDNVNLIWSSRG